MQFSSLVTLLALTAASALAAYTGPCSAAACGSGSAVCGEGFICVPFPAFDPALREGCTCSEALKKREDEGAFQKRREARVAELA